MRIVVSLVFVSLTISSCEISELEFRSDQKILFHYSYDNWAWGHQFNGWFIDNKGQVWSTKKSIHWATEEMNIISMKNEDLWISKDDVEEIYEESKDTVILILDKNDLANKCSLIKNIVNKNYSHPINTGADMGSFIFGCLFYDNKSDSYKRIILKAWGDWSFECEDTRAPELIEWLDSIQDKILELKTHL